jgi:sulfite reductase beta subunit-like hemoprotein
MDIKPDNNRDTFQGRGIRIKELEEQVEQLKQKLLETEQTKGLLCDKCGWSMKFPDESCRCELEEKLAYKDKRFDKLWDLCCSTEFTCKALKMFEEWENE